MASDRKCSNCGYVFTVSDKNICPECLHERKTVSDFSGKTVSSPNENSSAMNYNFNANKNTYNMSSGYKNPVLIQNPNKEKKNALKIWILIITFIVIGLVMLSIIGDNSENDDRTNKAETNSANDSDNDSSSESDSKTDSQKDDYKYEYKTLSFENPITEEGYIFTYHSVQKLGKTCEKAVAKNGYCFIAVKSTVKNTSKNRAYIHRPLDIYYDKDNFYQQYDYFGEISFQTPDSLAIKPFQSVEVTTIFEVPDNTKELVLCHLTDLEDHGIEYSIDISDINVKSAI